MSDVRVRFAPSPTGALHIGGAHTALFNWLWARHTGGTFVLRIEDTDRIRSTKEYEETIMAGMRWLNLDWDEGPDKGGDYGPYRQTERLDLYNKYAQQLVDEGKAYTEGNAVIFKVPLGVDCGFEDLVYGKIDVISDSLIDGRTGVMKDIVLIKSDGFPTYNYAVVVDDHLMKISHVIRGEDHISNTPKQVLLYKSLGWELPKFAHLPMILGRDKKKMSKRHGATGAFEYRDMGYLPDATFNFLSLLGWSPKGDVEIFDRAKAVEEFELKDINRKPSVFDMDKLNYINQQHLNNLPASEKIASLRPFWEKMGLSLDDVNADFMAKAFDLMGARAKTMAELADFSDYFVSFDAVTKRFDGSALSEDERTIMEAAVKALLACPTWTADALQTAMRHWCTEHDVKLKEVAMPLRLMLTGYKVSPGVFELLELFGKDETARRLMFFGFTK